MNNESLCLSIKNGFTHIFSTSYYCKTRFIVYGKKPCCDCWQWLIEQVCSHGSTNHDQNHRLRLHKYMFHCPGADHTSQKNRRVTCLSAELSCSLDLVPNDPPPLPTSSTTPTTLAFCQPSAPNSRRLPLPRFKPHQKEQTQTPNPHAASKSKLAPGVQPPNLDRDSLLDQRQRSSPPPEIQATKTKDQKGSRNQETKHASNRSQTQKSHPEL